MQRSRTSPVGAVARFHANQDVVDGMLATVITIVAFVSWASIGEWRNPLGGVLLALMTLPVAWRRRDPMRVLFITGSAIMGYSVLGYHEAGGYLGVFVAFLTVAANEPRKRATIAAAVTFGGILFSFACYAAFGSMEGWTTNLSATIVSFGVAWLIGDNLRVRRAYTRHLEQRAAELEVEREERAALAVSQERARIARELHDVVAHHVSVMVVQASGARRVLEKDPGAAAQALAAVESSGRTALTEMRRMLEVLRTDEAGVGPQPGLAELDRLVEQVRGAGLPVDLSVEGEARELPGALDLAAYRIIQEALTNTVKHAGKATAKVLVSYEPEALLLDVTDDGRGAAAPLLEGEASGGQGLIGMRERVALYGGALEAGPLFPGGYRVRARFPLEPLPKGSLAECCDEQSALSAVAAQALRERLDRGLRSPATRRPEPEPRVKPKVVPPLIGRIVPPHRTERHDREARPASRPGARPAGRSAARPAADAPTSASASPRPPAQERAASPVIEPSAPRSEP